MASTTCSSCGSRAAVETCEECNASLCDECLTKCRTCGKIVCKHHYEMTDGGRKLCGHCMARRALAKVEKRKRREKERNKDEGLSFEALSDEKDVQQPVPLSAEVGRESVATAEAPKAESGGAPESASYQTERDSVRLPIDENRPILTGSTPKSWPKWVYIFPALLVLAIAYFIISRLFFSSYL